jgi:hypothetical protein
MASDGVDASETWDCKIEIAAISGAVSVGFYASGGNSNFANNDVFIGAIANIANGNGMLLQTPEDSGLWNVQGNHFHIGQVIANGNSGIVVEPGAIANTFDVGPVEHNAYFGCYDVSGGEGSFANVWRPNGANTNGWPGGPC